MVKVESSGLAHAGADWLDFCQHLALGTAHRALVVYVSGRVATYSCGMHNLGLPEASTERQPAAEAVELLRQFTRYLALEAPQIRAGQTFALAPGAPVYRIEPAPAIAYEPDSLFRNPFGRWHLRPLADLQP